MIGFVLMHRSIIGNPKFRGKDDEYAAMWLILHAAWEPTTIRVNRNSVELERGQCAYAISYLAQAWECSKATAHARVRFLEGCGFIKTRAERGYTVITLCNYSEYQNFQSTNRTQDQTQAEREPNASRTNKKEGKEGKEYGGGGTRAPAREDASEGVPAPEAVQPEPTSSGTTSPDPAERIADHFCAERIRLWPGNPNFPAPRSSLIAQARLFLSAGAAPDLVTAEVSRVMETNRAKGDPNPPTSLRFCERSVVSRIAQTTGGAHHAPASQHRAQRRPAYDPDEARRRTAEGYALALERDQQHG